MPTLEFILKFYFGAGFVCAVVFTAALKESEEEIRKGTDLPKLGWIQALMIAFIIFWAWPYYLNEYVKEFFKSGR